MQECDGRTFLEDGCAVYLDDSRFGVFILLAVTHLRSMKPRLSCWMMQMTAWVALGYCVGTTRAVFLNVNHS